MPKRIMFEKFEDGFGRDVPIRDLVEASDDISDSQLAVESGLFRYHYPLLKLESGIVPLCDATSYSKRYEAYIGHTNFDLSPNEVDKIQRVPGVEVIDVFSRYRFRMCVGKAFEANDVFRGIQEVSASEIEHISEFPAIRIN